MPNDSQQINAIGYIRVSTGEQRDEGISPEVQEQMLRDYCKLHRIRLVALLRDLGVSAFKPLEKRPAGQELLARVHSGAAQAVLAVKLDRLFRNASDCLQVVSEWDRQRVALHFVSMGGASVDTRTAMGRFFLTIMAAVAEMERNLIRERTQEVMDHKRAKGERIGSIPYGYQLKLGGKLLEENLDEQRVLVYVRDLRECDGLSFAKIAAKLNEEGIPARGERWHKTTVIRLLHRDGAT